MFDQTSAYAQCRIVRSETRDGLPCQTVMPFMPAYLPTVCVTVLAHDSKPWLPRVASAFLQRNPWLRELLGKIAVLLSCNDLLDKKRPHMIDAAYLRRSNVIEWLSLIRYNLLRFATQQLTCPDSMAMEYNSMAAGRLSTHTELTRQRMKGCKVQLHRFDRHVRRARAQFDRLHAESSTLPLLNDYAVREAMVNAYKAARFTSSSGHDWSERHLLFACVLHAACPHVVPHAQAHDQTQALQLAEAVHAQFVQFENGYHLANAHIFARRWREACGEVEQEYAQHGAKRIAQTQHGFAQASSAKRQHIA
jgi:hypothetical protein